MMKWGVFETADEVHVAPAYDDGRLAFGHEVSERCPCRPTRQYSDLLPAASYLVHHDGH